jgi:hypothetical protein
MMGKRKPPTTKSRRGSPNRRETDKGQETVASRARRMADRIRRVADDVVGSFQFEDEKKRIAVLTDKTNEIFVDMLPVVGWLERRRSADTADWVRRRLLLVLNDAIQCAAFEIPEYKGGVVGRNDGMPSLGASRTAELVVMAMALSESLHWWADDIEADEASRVRKGNKHSADFTSVRWNGVDYTFSKGLQAECVKVLWEAWENSTPNLSEKTIGEQAGSSNDQFRLEHAFKPMNRKTGKREPHSAWGAMIKSVGKGVFCLSSH